MMPNEPGAARRWAAAANAHPDVVQRCLDALPEGLMPVVDFLLRMHEAHTRPPWRGENSAIRVTASPGEAMAHFPDLVWGQIHNVLWRLGAATVIIGDSAWTPFVLRSLPVRGCLDRGRIVCDVRFPPHDELGNPDA